MDNAELLNVDERFRGKDCTQELCHLGTTIESVPYLGQVMEGLSCQVIHFYTPSQAVSQAIRQLELPGKTVIPHVVEGVYSERWLFELSRQIAERRVSEVLALLPDLLRLKRFPKVHLEKLAIRRVSLSRLYYELSIFFALQQQLPINEKTPLIFLSSFFEREDIQAFNPSPFISIEPHSVSNIPSPSRIEWLNGYLRKAVASIVPLLGKNRGPQLPRTIFRRLEQVEVIYGEVRYRPPFLQLRKIEGFIRHQYKKPIKKFQKIQVRFEQISLIAFMRLRMWFIHFLGRQTQERVLIISPSINSRNKGYYLRLFKPLAQRLLANRQDLIFTLWSHDWNACISLIRSISKHKKIGFSESGAYFFPVTSLIELSKEREELFLNNDGLPAELAEVDDARTHLLINTLGAINSMKYAATVVYFYTKDLPFNKVLGVEEDIECVSVLNLLKPVLGRDYTTFIIPSCLPEYSVCYDCVNVDHLSVALPFIKRIFAEQNTNAGQLHVVGSQEWEEPYDQTVNFPKAVEKLIAGSTFVLGVLHQPIFVTMHGQTIYNNLTVNFLDIYERFLAKHPDACILIKPHPRDNLEQLKAYLPISDRIAVLPKETPNKLLYQHVDAAISIHSTMVTHALAHGVPVVSLYKYPDYVPLYDFIHETGGLATDSHDEALAWLARMQVEPEFRAEVHKRMTVLREQCLSVPTSQQIAGILATANRAG